MPDLVIDSSVAIKWFIPEIHSVEARRILDKYQSGEISLLAPDLINAEVGNIIWKKHIMQGLDVADAQAVLDEFRALQFTFTPTADLVDEAYQIAVRYHRTVYDSLYLALCEQMNCQCVTADEKLVNAVGSSFPNLIWLANW